MRTISRKEILKPLSINKTYFEKAEPKMIRILNLQYLT